MSANPYVQGWREWDEQHADLVIGQRNWQIVAGGLLLATIILAAGMVWLSNRTRYGDRDVSRKTLYGRPSRW